MPTVEEQMQVLLRNIPDRERIVFFVGAGISVSAGFPLWGPATASALRLAIERGLSVRAAAYAEEKLERFQYYEVFDILQGNLSEPAFIRIANEIFCKELRPSGIHRLLARITCRGIITTNFDECLSSAYVLEHDGLNPISDIRSAIATDRFFVVKPHGSVLNPSPLNS